LGGALIGGGGGEGSPTSIEDPILWGRDEESLVEGKMGGRVGGGPAKVSRRGLQVCVPTRNCDPSETLQTRESGEGAYWVGTVHTLRSTLSPQRELGNPCPEIGLKIRGNTVHKKSVDFLKGAKIQREGRKKSDDFDWDKKGKKSTY